MSQKKKHALVTLNIGNFPLARFTHPLFQEYCARHELEFVVIDQRKIRYRPRLLQIQRSFHYEKFQLFDLLDRFDRVVYLDSDILLNADCPNFFELVPESEIGCVFEDVGRQAFKRFEEMDGAQRLWGELADYRGGYFNAGMLILSRTHRDLFRFGPDREIGGRWPDQTCLNYYCEKFGFPKRNLGATFNLLPVFGNLWSSDSRRRQAAVIHYAGKDGKRLFHKDLPIILKAWEKT